MQAPAIHLWIGASISKLEYTLWWVDQSIYFIQNFGEAGIYKKVSGSSEAFLILYVDDILLIGNDTEFLDSIKGYLNKNFSMKDLGEAAYILGIKIYRDRSRRLIRLSQSTYLIKFWRSSKWISQRKGSCLCYKVWSWVRLNARPLQKIERKWKSFPVLQPWFYHVCNVVYQTWCVSCY